MAELERVLVPTDFSAASADALQRGLALAIERGASLQVLHVDLAHTHDPKQLDQGREETQRQVTRVCESWSGPGDADALRYELETIRAPSAFEALTEYAEEYAPSVLVMGTHAGMLRLGSLTEKMLRHAPCDVLVTDERAEGTWPADGGRILVPVDFSDNARRAIARAAALAGERSPITLLHVVDTPRRPVLYRSRIKTPFAVDPGLAARVEEQLRQWAPSAVDQVIVVEGEPRSTIVLEAQLRGASLVALGTGGLHGIADLLLGSTTERIARNATCPVLAVR